MLTLSMIILHLVIPRKIGRQVTTSNFLPTYTSPCNGSRCRGGKGQLRGPVCGRSTDRALFGPDAVLPVFFGPDTVLTLFSVFQVPILASLLSIFIWASIDSVFGPHTVLTLFSVFHVPILASL